MGRTAVHYARVSQEEQAKGDRVSIDQQLSEMQAASERNNETVIGVFVDKEKYKATQAPKKGKVVNPSGERADRPEFLKMLEVIKSGKPDIVRCWRDDRLVRHPRVNVALEDALDIGDKERSGKPQIELKDATDAVLDRFTMSIKASIWREENKRRAERVAMGKRATLQQGRWPSCFNAYGYTARKEEGKRGRIIERNDEQARWVLQIAEWFDAGLSRQGIRQRLIAAGAQQGEENKRLRRHEWSTTVIHQIIKKECYTGKLTWRFGDGTEYVIDIPPIVPRDLWERNQARIERNKILSTRNAKRVYLLQGLAYCGECDCKLRVKSYWLWYYKGKPRERKSPDSIYLCPSPRWFPEESHPRPYSKGVIRLDWEVWRKIVDEGIKRPNLIREQVQARQAELQAQGDDFDGEIANARRKLVEIDQERKFYQRQAGRKKITEQEFDNLMDETDENRQYWQSELDRLQELRDNAAKVRAGLDYATKLFTAMNSKLSEIDIPHDDLKKLPEERQIAILKERQKIIRALCCKVLVYADGRVKIEGVLDGSEAAQFELERP